MDSELENVTHTDKPSPFSQTNEPVERTLPGLLPISNWRFMHRLARKDES